jgi:hypothetical protein
MFNFSNKAKLGGLPIKGFFNKSNYSSLIWKNELNRNAMVMLQN